MSFYGSCKCGNGATISIYNTYTDKEELYCQKCYDESRAEFIFLDEKED